MIMMSDQAERIFLVSVYNVLSSVCMSLFLIALLIISLRFKNLFHLHVHCIPTYTTVTHSYTHMHTHRVNTHTLTLQALCGRSAAWKVIAREKKLWRVSYLFRCHWGAPLFSPSPSLYHFPLSSLLSVSLSLVPTCSLKSCSPPVVFRQSKDKVEICWEQWTVRQCVFVCERERGWSWVFEAVLPLSWQIGVSSLSI